VSPPRLKSALWVAAYLRARATQGLPGAVVRKGDETAGSVIVKINLLDGRARIFVATYGFEGERVWMPALSEDPASEPDCDAYIARAISRDGDLWVIEIEDRTGEVGLEGF
jgi:hypothetical protein